MSGGWLDIRGPEGARRAALLDGLTRIGGDGADVRLAVARGDELQVWNRPPRVIFVGRGERPCADGAPFEERPLRPGARFTWAGHEFAYGGEVAVADLAPLEELAPPLVASAGNDAFALRLRAGLACELGLADPQVSKRWRAAVQAGTFEPDACAREIAGRPLGAEAEQRLQERAGTLLRDFLMAPLLAGAAGARRKLRETTRNLTAFVVAQVLALLVFTLLVLATLLVVRGKGTSIDALLDRLLPG